MYIYIYVAWGETTDFISNQKSAWRDIYRREKRGRRRAQIGVDSSLGTRTRESLRGSFAFDTAKQGAGSAQRHNAPRQVPPSGVSQAKDDREMQNEERQTPKSFTVKLKVQQALDSSISWHVAKRPRRLSSL